ncbi:RNA polymerase sigma factor [Virgibacillus halodenitrificans]|uniref:RNA polymerase sigma factor n=1 Tax=Virgibacillus halodenitrificans TaxID=1482 RepID=UPI000EF46082|nr:RNA polymerase sigma factor [Virgibacillus halodenitrificans]
MEDQNTLEQLNNELNMVCRYLVTKGIPEKDAEDAVQEAAYKYLRFSDSIRSSRIRSWLIRVAFNCYYDQYRKNKRYIYNMEEIIFEDESADIPEMIVLEKESNDELYHLLNKLKPKHRELLLLKYVSELSYEDISKLLGIRISSIKTNLYRARKKLIKLYEEASND